MIIIFNMINFTYKLIVKIVINYKITINHQILIQNSIIINKTCEYKLTLQQFRFKILILNYLE
jgi:hypothetical protein